MRIKSNKFNNNDLVTINNNVGIVIDNKGDDYIIKDITGNISKSNKFNIRLSTHEEIQSALTTLLQQN